MYFLVDAQCRAYDDGSSSCDDGSPTTCGGAPVYQRSWPPNAGPVLTRSIGYNGHSYWHVLAADEGLVHCGGSNYALVGSEGDALAST
eukprot:COSAG05_NODE_6723_length_913_cov_3.074939_1_plen_87_part_01